MAFLFGKPKEKHPPVAKKNEQVKKPQSVIPVARERLQAPKPKPKPKERLPFVEHVTQEKRAKNYKIQDLKEGKSMIGKSVTIKGELFGDEDITIEGRVEGKIVLKKSLNIGESGNVIADINASRVTISGKVEGNIYAAEKIELIETSNVNGNLFAPKIVVAEGAHFQGKVDMSGSKVDLSTPAEKKPYAADHAHVEKKPDKKLIPPTNKA